MKSQYAYGINILLTIIGIGATTMGIGIDKILPEVSGYWFLIPGTVLVIIGISGIIALKLGISWPIKVRKHPADKAEEAFEVSARLLDISEEISRLESMNPSTFADEKYKDEKLSTLKRQYKKLKKKL